MEVDAIFLLTGKKLESKEIVVLPQGTFVRDGQQGYHLVPSQAIASVHFKGTKDEIDKIFSQDDHETDKVPSK